jgi:hypothetical protein
MRRRLSFLMPSPAMAVAVAALLAACTGLAVAAGSSSQVIHACANKKTGALRIANTSKCRHGELPVRWNLTGPQGPAGPAGVAGAKGESGPLGQEGQQGPGAITFTTTAAAGKRVTLAKLDNGLALTGTCELTKVVLALEPSGAGKLQMSGIATVGKNLTPIDLVGFGTDEIADESVVDYSVVARDVSFVKFARIDAHGDLGSPCTFWGMITPSS